MLALVIHIPAADVCAESLASRETACVHVFARMYVTVSKYAKTYSVWVRHTYGLCMCASTFGTHCAAHLSYVLKNPLFCAHMYWHSQQRTLTARNARLCASLTSRAPWSAAFPNLLAMSMIQLPECFKSCALSHTCASNGRSGRHVLLHLQYAK
jgi:hypothetical protein